MRMIDEKAASVLPPQVFEVNPAHPLVVGLHRAQQANLAHASLIAEQVRAPVGTAPPIEILGSRLTPVLIHCRGSSLIMPSLPPGSWMSPG